MVIDFRSLEAKDCLNERPTGQKAKDCEGLVKIQSRTRHPPQPELPEGSDGLLEGAKDWSKAKRTA